MNTEVLSSVNWLAVLVAALAYFAIGSIWYTVLFGSRWVKDHGINRDDPNMKKGVAATFLMSFIQMIVVCIGLAILVFKTDMTIASAGAKLGLLTGICFAFTAISISFLYLKKSTALHIIDGGYHVVGHVVAAVILAVWR